jgi:hypothetical protein
MASALSNHLALDPDKLEALNHRHCHRAAAELRSARQPVRLSPHGLIARLILFHFS